MFIFICFDGSLGVDCQEFLSSVISREETNKDGKNFYPKINETL